jgi:hypothetical protein
MKADRDSSLNRIVDSNHNRALALDKSGLKHTVCWLFVEDRTVSPLEQVSRSILL